MELSSTARVKSIGVSTVTRGFVLAGAALEPAYTPGVGLTVGVDVGGTKLLAAIVDGSGKIQHRLVKETSGAATPAVVKAIGELLSSSSEKVSLVGVAAAAYIAYPEGRVAFSPNVEYGEPEIKAAVAGAFEVDVLVENDANAAAWGERLYGAAQGVDDMIMLTVGTGIGGGIVTGGRLYRGAEGFAGEFGHMTILEGGPQCACGERGCFEAMASGTAIERMAGERKIGSDPGETTGELVNELARNGDQAAVEVLSEAGRWLGIGISNLINLFDPALVVIGGGVAEAGDLLLLPARMEVRRRIGPRRQPPRIVAAELGNEAGAIGVAALTNEEFERR